MKVTELLDSLEDLRQAAEEKFSGFERDAHELFRGLENLIARDDDDWFDPSADGSDARARSRD